MNSKWFEFRWARSSEMRHFPNSNSTCYARWFTMGSQWAMDSVKTKIVYKVSPNCSSTESFVGWIDDPVGWRAQEAVLQKNYRSRCILLSILFLGLLHRLLLLLHLVTAERYPMQFQNISIISGHKMHFNGIPTMCNDFWLPKPQFQIEI